MRFPFSFFSFSLFLFLSFSLPLPLITLPPAQLSSCPFSYSNLLLSFVHLILSPFLPCSCPLSLLHSLSSFPYLLIPTSLPFFVQPSTSLPSFTPSLPLSLPHPSPWASLPLHILSVTDELQHQRGYPFVIKKKRHTEITSSPVLLNDALLTKDEIVRIWSTKR